jgi:Ca2+-binding EF-hand superfamily protein
MNKEKETSYERAETYLMKHRIVDLFEDLSTKLCFKQPDEVDEFIIDQLKMKQHHGFKTSIYSDEEIGNVFCLFDLKREGYITRRSSIEALKVLASSEYQNKRIDELAVQIPDMVDIAQFVRLCDNLIGINTEI